jgi:hypothetical protein
MYTIIGLMPKNKTKLTGSWHVLLFVHVLTLLSNALSSQGVLPLDSLCQKEVVIFILNIYSALG